MIYFIRHGESEANATNVFAGQRLDSALTDKGRTQAEAEAKQIIKLGLKIEKIITSPLIRALDTAKIIAHNIGYEGEIVVDERITEYDMGSLTGTPVFHVSSKILTGAENAEDPGLFMKRIKSFLDEFKSEKAEILMVSHAGVGRMIETIRTDADPKLFYDIPRHGNAMVIKLDWLGV